MDNKDTFYWLYCDVMFECENIDNISFDEKNWCDVDDEIKNIINRAIRTRNRFYYNHEPDTVCINHDENSINITVNYMTFRMRIRLTPDSQTEDYYHLTVELYFPNREAAVGVVLQDPRAYDYPL